jgi:hypothetical protein
VPERSASDIGSRFIKDAQIAGDSASLAAFFPLDDGVGDVVADLSFGGQAHGSIMGRSPDYYWVESDFEWRMLNVGGTGTGSSGVLSLASGIGSNLVLLPNAKPCEVRRDLVVKQQTVTCCAGAVGHCDTKRNRPCVFYRHDLSCHCRS